MINQYKRTDIFRCNFNSHRKFGSRVSAFNILEEKHCYPDGCIFLKWHCRLLEKGKKCVRGYNYVGRNCEGCAHYEDEKVHFQPSIQISDEGFTSFKFELEEFKEWLADHLEKTHLIFGTINSVKPRFIKTVDKNQYKVKLAGYIVIFNKGFIGRTEFSDYFYLVISSSQQDRWLLRRGDTIECSGTLTLNKGRLVFTGIHKIEFEKRSELKPWTRSEALVARQTATNFKRQPAKCIDCWYGALVDVTDISGSESKNRRELFCSKGLESPEACYLKVGHLRRQSECPY